MTVSVATVLLVACGTDRVELGAAVDSGIEAIPVPETAEGPPKVRTKRLGFPENVWVLKAASYEELVSWYEEWLPAGSDWNPEESPKAWMWCALRSSEGEFTQWNYVRGNKLLRVHIGDIDPPAVQIGIDDRRSCKRMVE